MKHLIVSGIFLLCLFTLSCDRTPEHVNQPPTASISASPKSGRIPLTVEFSASASSDPEGSSLTRLWEFPDGSTSSQTSITKTFEAAGSYTVNLTVEDDNGLQDTDNETITADAPPPDLFPTQENAQWVYFVKSTNTENGSVSGYDEGYVYIITKERDPEYTNIDVLDLRITGKKYFDETSLIPGENIHMLHVPGKSIDIYHFPSNTMTYSTMLDLELSSWSNYAFFFSQASSQSATLSTASVAIGLGTFQTMKVSHHRDNWGENFVSERYDITESEYFYPDIGLVYRETSRYVNFTDCFTCPVYGGSTEFELVGYSIPQKDGTVLQGGSGYNTSNPYGGNLGLLTIWAEEDIGYTKVYLDGGYVGTISNYWTGGITCDQSGALNVTYPAGTYYLTAESGQDYYWEGNVTFPEGTCDDIQLLLTKKSIGSGRIPLAEVR